MENIFSQRIDVEDTVDYSLYRSFESCSSESERPAETLLAAAVDFATIATSFASKWTDGYIWHKDTFALHVKSLPDVDVPVVHGKTRFGDCVEDEWFIVSLLLEITKEFPDVVVSVNDNDGEFLLIEAADYIPTWLDPSTSKNRVFLHKGLVHIIPMPRTPAEIPLYPTGQVSLQRALGVIRGAAPTEAPKAVQDVISARLAGYPQKAMENMHRAKCYIPHSIAHILHHDPQLVAPAVEAFYLRDPIAMKACYKMEKFPPSTNVMSTVKMNRPQYAQLTSQKFHPPKPFRLPPLSSPHFKACELGMKMACGFEMLYADRHLRDTSNRNKDWSIENYDFEADAGWKTFLRRLDKLNYFRSEIRGSKLFKHLESIAKAQYLQSISSDDDASENPIDKIDSILSLPIVPESDLSQEKEESDQWMNIDPTKLDRLLDEEKLRMSEEDWKDIEGDDSETSEMDEEDKRDMEELSKMLGSFTSFVEKKSGISGALFPGEMEVDEESEDEDMNNPAPDAGKQPAPELDDAHFWESILANPGISIDEFTKFIKGKGPAAAPDILRPPQNPNLRLLESDSEDEEEDEALSEEEEGAIDDAKLKEYMRQMDRELSQTKIGTSFERLSDGSSKEGPDTDFPVDLDLNLVKNMLESFEAQEGLPGPAGSILGSLGIGLSKKRK